MEASKRLRGALEPAGAEMRPSPREARSGKDMVNSWGILESLHTVNPSQWLPLQVGLEGQARWLSHLMIYNLS